MIMICFHDEKKNTNAVLHVNLKKEKNMSIKKLTIEMQKQHENLTKKFQKIYISNEEHSCDEASINVA
jgi:hypothetical protein